GTRRARETGEMTRADAIGRRTFADVGCERLRALCEAVGFDAPRIGEMQGLFRRVIAPWGERRIDARTDWRSDISEDGSPFELSLALSDGVPEVRILAEAQGEGGTLTSNRDAARALLRGLQGEFGLCLERLEEIEDLFLPGSPEGRFSLWHAAAVRP